jgi:hypothetical protein
MRDSTYSYHYSNTESRHQIFGSGRGGREAKSYDGEKAWSSINHSILSDHDPFLFLILNKIPRIKKIPHDLMQLSVLHAIQQENVTKFNLSPYFKERLVLNQVYSAMYTVQFTEV